MQDSAAFPASAASSLISGYCQDFIGLAASMAQTLEQVTMRGLELGDSRDQLARVEHGMRHLADAIGGVLAQVAAPPAEGSQAPARQSARPGGGAVGARRPAPPGPGAKAPPPSLPRRPHSARPGPRAMPIAPAGDSVPPAVDDGIKRPVVPTVDATRVPPRPTATCTLQGSHDTMPLRSVFQFLSRMRKSGTLRVSLPDEEMTFDLSDGCLVATASNNAPDAERIGDLLVDLRFVDAAELEQFARQHGDSLRQLGGALVQNRRITEGQLAEALELQVSRRFRRAIAARQASYDFRECPRPGGDGRIRIRTFELANDISGEDRG